MSKTYTKGNVIVEEIKGGDYKNMASSGARIMYDRLYGMLKKKTLPQISEERIESILMKFATDDDYTIEEAKAAITQLMKGGEG